MRRQATFELGEDMVQNGTLLDRLAIADVVTRERMARDDGDWEAMAACYHRDSSIDISWFQGGGHAFVARTKEFFERMKASGDKDDLNFHILQPVNVKVRGDRAIAEMPCTLRNFLRVDGVEASFEGHTRLFWRSVRSGEDWLIAGLRVVYIRDLIMACNPSSRLVLDQAQLDSHRQSYRYLSYLLKRDGLSPRDDLPGADRPETVAALREQEALWLRTD
ncbi:nuclear transport factor 2 family protein [Rhizorhabdus dicambivorans]|nr:nuclear transport factor 2 family protein [Rhizorhabdus dicambivorans]